LCPGMWKEWFVREDKNSSICGIVYLLLKYGAV